MLEKEQIYHFYNQGNNRQKIFFNSANYYYFLSKFKKEMLPVCDLLAYCLMPNHFHFLIYTKPEAIVLKRMGASEMTIISAKIKTFLSSYTQAINKQEGRSGSVFRQKSKIKLVNNRDKNYPFIAFQYIHQNPMKAGLVAKMEDWKYSSFNEYWSDQEQICNQALTREIIDFGDDDFYEQSYDVIF